MGRVAGNALEAGREAIGRYAWREGYDLLTEADAVEPLLPADLEDLAAAAWWTGRLEACIAARERAFAGYSSAQNSRRAAIVAMALAKDYYAKLASSIGTAWVARAERLLADEPESVEHGYLERLLSVIAFEGRADFDAALEHARSALDIGMRFGDSELQALALQDKGRALVAKGEVAEGMAMIDEATVAAVSGELSPYNTGVVYCNTIASCKELADYRRAGDWTEAAKRWCDRQAISGFPGLCRVYRASIMLVRGAWPEAELEARRACDELMEFNLGYAAEAFYELGEMRMRRGDLTAAHELFSRAHELGRDPQPGLALLHLAEGNADAANTCIGQALDEELEELPRTSVYRPARASGRLHRARLLPARVDIALAAGDTAKARTAAEELTAIGEAYGSDALDAAACTARSRVALEEGDSRSAVADARQALRLWQGVDAPYEEAQARMALALGFLAEGNAENGALELRAAASTFERLGAVPDGRRAREQLEALGVEPGRAVATDGSETKTFMFTDIVRSTNLVEAIGDDAWTQLVRWHDETLRSLFAANGGQEIDHAGDGFFVAFATPEDAVECAVAVQRRLLEHRRTHGFAPEVRIGLHKTEAMRQGGTYRGKGVHETARISALAEGGEILASAQTLADAAIRFPTSNGRAVELKGIPHPVELSTIDWRT